MNEWEGVKEVKKGMELENMLSFLDQNEENDNSFSSEVRKSFSEENTNTPISINSLDVEHNEIINNLINGISDLSELTRWVKVLQPSEMALFDKLFSKF